MKKILMPLLAAALTLSAVQWETEQITDVPVLTVVDRPLLALSQEGNPSILFTQYTIENEEIHLYCASNQTDSWLIQDVDSQYDSDMNCYDIDVDSDGYSHVVYTVALTEDEDYDFFYVTDKTGEFVPHRLTSTGGPKYALNIDVDRGNKPHILYMCYDEIAWETYLFYGWIDEFYELHAEKITENSVECEEGSDFVIDDSGKVHIFYTDEDSHLWYIHGSMSAWGERMISELTTNWLSAELDKSDNLHLVYSAQDSPLTAHYSTNRSGLWQDEVICEEEQPHRHPNLAVDDIDSPHVIWCNSTNLFYSAKTESGWSDAELIELPQSGIETTYGRTFQIGAGGYGHLVYMAEDEEDNIQIYYARSKGPLAPGIAEEPSQTSLLKLEVIGSKVYFSLPQTGPIRLDLFDAGGRRVRNLASDIYPQGEHSLPINTAGLSSGVYFVRLESGVLKATGKILKMR